MRRIRCLLLVRLGWRVPVCALVLRGRLLVGSRRGILEDVAVELVGARLLLRIRLRRLSVLLRCLVLLLRRRVLSWRRCYLALRRPRR